MPGRFSSSRVIQFDDPKGRHVTRIVLMFRLSSLQRQQHLLEEFELYGGDGVVARAVEHEGFPALAVETYDSSTSLWEIRATVGLFDDVALEIEADAPDDDSL